MIIGISGKIGSGKDTVGKIIQYLIYKKNNNVNITYEYFINHKFGEISKWEIKKFADKLKDIVCLLIGCTREQLEDQDFKNKELGEEWWYYKRIITTINKLSFNKIPYLTNNRIFDGSVVPPLIKLTPRKLLQLLGTDCGRNIIHPDIWVNSLFANYKPVKMFACDNCMQNFYPHEFEDDKSGQTRGSSIGFKARLVRRIIENIQLSDGGGGSGK